MCAAEYGSKPWVNPVLSKALEIKASSPPSRYTDPKVRLLVLVTSSEPSRAARPFYCCCFEHLQQLATGMCTTDECRCTDGSDTAKHGRHDLCLHLAVFGAMQALVSGQFLNTSFAGPRYVRAPPVSTGPAPGPGTTTSSRAAPSTWWQLDLGPQHRLLCNYYVIRHDGSQEGYARSWSLQVRDCQHPSLRPLQTGHAGQPRHTARRARHLLVVPRMLHLPWAPHPERQPQLSYCLCCLCCFVCRQGSNDLQHWLDLRRHTDDTTIRLPGQYGSWPVAGPAACMPFRAFRLLLTGPTQVGLLCLQHERGKCARALICLTDHVYLPGAAHHGKYENA